MDEKNYFLVHVRTASGPSPYVSLTELSCRCGVHPELIHRFVTLGLLDYAEGELEGEAIFNSEAIAIVRKILRLRNQLGVNYAGIGVILELMSRIEHLENTVRELENRLLGDG
jgi:MerR family transcriptional regulator, heat shock protein HspR